MSGTGHFDSTHALLEKAKSSPAIPTALVNPDSLLSLEGARLAFEHELIVPVFVGDLPVIRDRCAEIDWDISCFHAEHAQDPARAAEISVGLARSGEVASLMKGNLHTDTLIRAVLDRKSGLRTSRLLSHIFHMTWPGMQTSLCITDAVINILPSVKHKIEIVENAVTLLHALGNPKPRIALLSGTEVSTPVMPSSVDAATIAALVGAENRTDVAVDGPFAFDVAVSASAAKEKGIDSCVAGSADVIVVPNIETGNALFKQMVHFMNATAAGVVLGATVPIILTSRSDSPNSRLASAALATIVSRKE